MDIFRADQVPVKELDHFLQANVDINEEILIQSGYVAKLNDTIIGCFVLDVLELDEYWLKQLYIVQSEATSLPILLESILVLAKEQHAKQVFVHSHQPLVDILLEALQFNPHKEQKVVDKKNKIAGKWWTYHVS